MDQEARQATVKTLDMGIVLALVAMDVIARLLPHAPNFTPVAASALFAGVFLGSRLLALTVPLGAMGLSDSVIGFYDWHVMVAVLHYRQCSAGSPNHHHAGSWFYRLRLYLR
jgi:hypothetical protein